MSSNEKIELKKNIGLYNGVSLIISVIVGSGIFISPKGVIKEVGSIGLSLIIWVLCGILSIFGAQTYAELGCMIPKAGGDYEYILTSFGGLCGFLFVWGTLLIVIPTTNAVAALTFADYVLQPFFSSCDPPQSSRLLFAASAVLILTILNCVSVKWVTRVDTVFSAGKMIGLLLIIAIGAFCLFIGRTENFESVFLIEKVSAGKVAVAFYSGLFCYTGWNYLNFVVEEIKEPTKTLPRSIWIGLSIVIVVYTFVNVAYFTLLTPKEMISSNAVAVSFSEKVLGRFSWIMSIFVALSTFGLINGVLFSTSRIAFGAARNNHMPAALALINIKFLTPIASIVFMCLATLVCLLVGDIFVLINMAVLAEYIFISLSVVGMLWLRKKRPDLDRPIRVQLFFPVVFLVVCVFIILMTLYQIPKESFMCLAVITVGLPVYYFGVIWKKPVSIQNKLKIDVFSLRRV